MNEFIDWIEKKVQGKPCPACGSNAGYDLINMNGSYINDPIYHKIGIKCNACGAEFDEEAWDKATFNILDSIKDLEEIDNTPSANLLIFQVKYSVSSKREESFEKVIKNIKDQLLNNKGFLVLPNEVDFIKAVNFNRDDELITLYANGKVIMEDVKS